MAGLQPEEETPDERRTPPKRESIWSVSEQWRAVYFPLFTTLTIIGAGYVVWHGITHRPQGDIHDAIVVIILRLAPTIIVSAGVSVVVTELGRYSAMLSDILREKTDKWIAKSRKEDREKALAKGIAEGRAEGQAEGRAEGQAEGRAEKLKAAPKGKSCGRTGMSGVWSTKPRLSLLTNRRRPSTKRPANWSAGLRRLTRRANADINLRLWHPARWCH